VTNVKAAFAQYLYAFFFFFGFRYVLLTSILTRLPIFVFDELATVKEPLNSQDGLPSFGVLMAR